MQNFHTIGEVLQEASAAERRASDLNNSSPLSQLDAALTADFRQLLESMAVASILEVICRTTGMGFAAVARVTRDQPLDCLCCL